MKKNKIKIFILLFVLLSFSLVFFSFGEITFAQTAETSYQPLSPLSEGAGPVDTSKPESYLDNIYGIALGVAAIFAVIMLMICGLQYMTSSAISSKESAKKRCWAAILGLGLLLASWLILNTINPDLVKLPLGGVGSKIQNAIIKKSSCGDDPTCVYKFNDSDSDVVFPDQESVPSITSFQTIGTPVIVEGESIPLTWASTNATTCYGNLFSTGGATNSSTGIPVSPAITTTYTLTCQNLEGDTSANLKITVIPRERTDPNNGNIYLIVDKVNGAATCEPKSDYTSEGAQTAITCSSGLEANEYACCVYVPEDDGPPPTATEDWCYKISKGFFGFVTQQKCGPGWTESECLAEQASAVSSGEKITESCVDTF